MDARSARAAEARELQREVMSIRDEMLEHESQHTDLLALLHPSFVDSGRNLLHYVKLRQRDLRALQARLAALGLSSLGRAESATMCAVENVLATLGELAGEPFDADPERLDYDAAQRLLTGHTVELLDSGPEHRNVRIMVTMPSVAADDYAFVRDLLAKGMDCMRINCAHDGPAEWERMIDHLRRAREELGKPCRIEMDLGGPKLRTGPLRPELAVLRVRPVRDATGNVVSPARVWLAPHGSPLAPSEATAVVPVDPAWLARLAVGNEIRFVDARRSRRRWTVTEVTPAGAWAAGRKTAYVVPGIELTTHKRSTRVEELPVHEGALVLDTGELLIVTRDLRPGGRAEGGTATIGCTLPEAFDHAKVGHAIVFDDGAIAGVIEKIEPDAVTVRITRTPPGGRKLRADKGINLPDSKLKLSALTAEDLTDLAFVVAHADIIGLSFANRVKDVAMLLEEIARLGERRPAIVLKIETRRGFENLPSLLMAAMQTKTCGIMIARGDLAVECGFVRLAEAQEEILWMCEAAHVPVIWATQVLESLAKEGMPSRAEITDAAMADRAECVMLNKGPHILTAVEVLDDILSRMQTHQAKKRSMMRKLKIAHMRDPDQ